MSAFQPNPYAVAMLVASVLMGGIALYARRRGRQLGVPFAPPFEAACWCMTVWSFFGAAEAAATTLHAKVVANDLLYLGVVWVAPLLLRVCAIYCGAVALQGGAARGWLSVVPVIVLVGVWTNPWHELYYRDLHVEWEDGIAWWTGERGPVFWLQIGSTYLLLVTCLGLLVRALVRAPRLWRQTLLLIVGALMPWVFNLGYVAGLFPTRADLTPFAFGLTAAVFGLSLLRLGFLDLVPVARDAVIEGMAEGILVLDEGGRVRDMNARAEGMLGAGRREAKGRAAADVLRGWDALLETLSAGDAAELAVRHGEASYQVQVRPVTRHGRGGGHIVTLRDVTAARRAGQEQRELAQALRGISECVSVADGENRIRFVNDAFLATYGYAPDEIMGQPAAVLHSPRNRPGLSRRIAADTMRGGWSGELLQVRKGGSDVRVAQATAVILDEKGQPLGMVVAAADLTEHERVQAELLHAKEAAELAQGEAFGADRAKSAFLANMSHELRTPLNAIIGYSEILREEAEDSGLGEEVGPDLLRIAGAGRHLLGVINDILDLSKVEAGKMLVFVEEVDVLAVVEEVGALQRPLAESKALSLVVEVEPDVGVIRADRGKVRQALLALVGNACKFTDQGTVTVRVARRSGLLRIEVADTGPGLTPDQVARLFRPFVQIDAEAQRRKGGTGLGLALARKLARLMGGDITVASEALRGSTFTLTVPTTVEAAPAA